MGVPDSVSAAGTAIAGWPVVVNGAVKASTSTDLWRPSGSRHGHPTGLGGVANTGLSSRSNPCHQRAMAARSPLCQTRASASSSPVICRPRRTRTR
ncbi:hypothetical protein Z951_01810 [Streptomyces sp. PRh5]|nr:hypothetical protein Z951_01810 [Streptomyces sp. PRh5]